MKMLFYLGTFVFGFLGVGLACAELEQALCGGVVMKSMVAIAFIFLLMALASWHRARNYSEDETTEGETSPPNREPLARKPTRDPEHQSVFALMAKTGMTISLIVSMLVILFYGLLLPVLSFRSGTAWPRAVVYAGYTLLTFVPIGFILSGLGLAGLRGGRKGILGPGLTGTLLSLLIGLPFCSGFLMHQVRYGTNVPPAGTVSAQGSATVSAPVSHAVASRADGVFIPAPERADMIHDSKRNLLYISAGDSVLRYQLASNTFLTPLVLGGNLRGIDLSPDNDTLAVADGDGSNGRIGIYLVDLKTGTNSRVTFPAQSQESGAYSVAFGADGAVWITTSLSGSGWVPLRKFNPATHNRIQIQSVTQDTMLAPSADRQMIGFAEANISSGDYGRIRCQASQLPPTILKAGAFIKEIGINRDGTQLAVPTYQNVLLSGSTVPKIEEPQVVGVACHPQRDFVFLACGGASVVAVYETKTGTKVKELDFGDKFEWTNRSFQSGRLRLSANGAWLFCTVNGGIRYTATGLD